ncbi:MAG: hypothetical protein EOM72_09675 [Opitutae bacterium]|nr:hypothetical protein [Opitutae bacterium]
MKPAKILALNLVAAIWLAMGAAYADAAAQVGQRLDSCECCRGEESSGTADSSCCREHGDMTCSCSAPTGASLTAMMPEWSRLIARSIYLGRLAAPEPEPASRTDAPPSRPPIFV